MPNKGQLVTILNRDGSQWDGSVIVASSLVPEEYDYIALTYVPSGNGAGEIQTAVYKLGGSGGTTVATLTLAYDSSNRISTVTRT